MASDSYEIKFSVWAYPDQDGEQNLFQFQITGELNNVADVERIEFRLHLGSQYFSIDTFVTLLADDGFTAEVAIPSSAFPNDLEPSMITGLSPF